MSQGHPRISYTFGLLTACSSRHILFLDGGFDFLFPLNRLYQTGNTSLVGTGFHSMLPMRAAARGLSNKRLMRPWPAQRFGDFLSTDETPSYIGLLWKASKSVRISSTRGTADYVVLDSVPGGFIGEVGYAPAAQAEPASVRFGIEVHSGDTAPIWNPAWKRLRMLGLKACWIENRTRLFRLLPEIHGASIGGCPLRFSRPH
jgi:hypothetical protein